MSQHANAWSSPPAQSVDMLMVVMMYAKGAGVVGSNGVDLSQLALRDQQANKLSLLRAIHPTAEMFHLESPTLVRAFNAAC